LLDGGPIDKIKTEEYHRITTEKLSHASTNAHYNYFLSKTGSLVLTKDRMKGVKNV